MRRTTVLLVTVLLLSAVPALAYTVYLTDGSTLAAKEKYRIADGKAYVLMLNGTETVLDPALIDIARTEEANTADFGAARIIEDGQIKQVEEGKRIQPVREKRLADLIAERGARTRALPGERRAGPQAGAGGLSYTGAGWVDLASLPRRPFSDPQIATELTQALSAQGVERFTVHRGSSENLVLAEVVAGTESRVFRALLATANALRALGERHGNAVAGIELLLVTPAGERGGQFTLTPDQAEDLLAQRVGLPTFFLANVEF